MYQDIDLVVCPGLFEGQFYGPGLIDVLLTSHSGEAFRSTRNQKCCLVQQPVPKSICSIREKNAVKVFN